MVRIERYLKTLDLSILLKFGLEVLMALISWDLSDEDVVVNELLFVASQKLLIELEGSAPLSVNGKVFHGFTGFVEF
jgi:hypothetical protein